MSHMLSHIQPWDDPTVEDEAENFTSSSSSCAFWLYTVFDKIKQLYSGDNLPPCPHWRRAAEKREKSFGAGGCAAKNI